MRSSERASEERCGARDDLTPHIPAPIAEGSSRFMVLPVRMEARVVVRLDEAWRSLGLRSRTALFRQALGFYLLSAGEEEVAALVAPGARPSAASAAR